MGKINEENYEVFFLDYLEGNLAPELVEELLTFLDEHPHLKEELEDVDLLKVTPPNLKFPDKKNLLKGQLPNLVSEKNFETYFVAAHEGDLSRKELDLVDQFIKDNGLVIGQHYKDYDDFKLVPDYSIIYDEKASLLRSKSKVLSLYHYGAGVAAALMFFGLIQFSYVQNADNSVFASSEFSNRIKLRKELRVLYAKGIAPVNSRLVSHISTGSVTTDETSDEIVRMIGVKRDRQFNDGKSFDHVLMIEETPIEDFKRLSSKDVYLQTASSAVGKNAILRYDPSVFESEIFHESNKKSTHYSADDDKIKILNGIRENAKEVMSKVFGVAPESLNEMQKTKSGTEELHSEKQSTVQKAIYKFSKLTSKISGKGVQLQAATDKEGSEYNLKVGKVGLGFKRRKN